MCTRYSLHDLPSFQRLLKRFGLKMPAELRAIYNATLTTRMPAITKRKGTVALEPLAFGTLMPPKEPGQKPLLLANARAETLLARSAFKDAAQHRRCLVPADGFFEWEKQGKARLPHYFQRRDSEPFFFAGLWRAETAISPPAFVIVTTTPNELLAPIHDRMPVILAPEDYERWMTAAPAAAQTLIQPFADERMRAYPVSKAVGNVRNNSAALIAEIAPPVA